MSSEEKSHHSTHSDVPQQVEEQISAANAAAADPNHPLNWSAWEKFLTYGTICFYTFLATANASNLSVAIVPLTKYFHTSAARVSYLLCFNTLMLGLGNLIWVPLMRVLGKRPIYLIAPAILVAANVWSYKATSFGSLLGARILSGFAAAAGDAPVPAIVAELFPVTDRGQAMMFFQLALSCGFFIGPFINAYVAQYTGGWQWTCGWIAIAAGVNWVMAVFLVWETSHTALRGDGEAFQPKLGFLARLSVTRGYKRGVSPLRVLTDIIMLAIYPPITWGGLLTGTFVGWNMIVQFEAAVVFVVPPYKWQTHAIGLLALSGLIGTFLAIFVGGKLIDMIANRMTIKNGGIRRPEYRLAALLIPAVIGPMGLLIYGLTIAAKTSWIGPAFGYGMQGFGLTACSNILATYAVDSCHELAAEALVYFFVIRSVIACMLSLFGFDWIAAAGLKNTFGQMIGIQYALLLIGLVFYFRGEKIRNWTATYGPLKSRRSMMATENGI